MLPLRAKVGLGTNAMKVRSAFLNIRLFGVISRTLVGGGGLTTQQRCSRCILQPQPTEQTNYWIEIKGRITTGDPVKEISYRYGWFISGWILDKGIREASPVDSKCCEQNCENFERRGNEARPAPAKKMNRVRLDGKMKRRQKNGKNKSRKLCPLKDIGTGWDSFWNPTEMC